MSANLELKARVPSLDALASIAERASAEYRGVLIQTDTYFAVPVGRLKLRETEGQDAELVYYEREESGAERWSTYERLPVPDPRRMREVLSRALGVKAVVNKRRTLYIHRGARIHLDEVESLGRFIEFEVAREGEQDDAVARHLAELRSLFGIDETCVERPSYCDLIVGKSADSGS